MNETKTYLFVNPTSGSHSPARLQYTLNRLDSFGIKPEVFEVRNPQEIFEHFEIIDNINESNLFIVAGGDGTLNAVLNAMNPDNHSTLAILPFGTSNVMAAEIGISSLDDALERINMRKTKLLSLGLIELGNRKLRFLLMTGIGLDGAIVRDVLPLAKKYLKQAAYALSAVKNALSWDSSQFSIITPDKVLKCHSVIICNSSRYGGNFILSPESSPLKSGLSAICITGNDRLTYLGCVWDLLRGNIATNKNIVQISSSTFEIIGKKSVQIDGDFVGYTPARVNLQENFTRIIV